ncbi:MAG TPA: hypothetical protein VF228_08010 [Iamia sp.]
MTDDLRTHLGVLPGGLPVDVERADVAIIIGEPDGTGVRVHALRVVVDPVNAEARKEDRELELVASFWMRTDYFVSTFGRVAADIRRRRDPR